MIPPRELTLQFLAEPADVNFGGKVHGGKVVAEGVPAGLYRLTLHVGDAPIVVQPLEVGVPSA